MNMKSTSKEKKAKARSSRDRIKIPIPIQIPLRKHSSRKKTENIFLKSAFIFARQKMKEKHQTNEQSLNIKIINDIIYNEKSHIVTMFKDFLVFDDANEFLKRFYKYEETMQKLPKIFEFYEIFSKIFANYINLPEAKYMYKNILRKQKMIDNLQKKIAVSNDGKESDNTIFNTELYNSIIHQSEQFDTSFLYQDSMEKHKELESGSCLLELDMSHKSCKQDTSSIFNLLKLVDSIGRAEKGSFAAIKDDEGYFSTLQKSRDGTGKSKSNKRQKVSKKMIKDYPKKYYVDLRENNLMQNMNFMLKDIASLHLQSNHGQVLQGSMKNTSDKIPKEKSQVNLNCNTRAAGATQDKGKLTDGKNHLSILSALLKKNLNILSVKKTNNFNKKITTFSGKVSLACTKKKPESVEKGGRDKQNEAIFSSNPNSNQNTIVASGIPLGNPKRNIVHSPEIRDVNLSKTNLLHPQSRHQNIISGGSISTKDTNKNTLSSHERKKDNMCKSIQANSSRISKIKKKIVSIVQNQNQVKKGGTQNNSGMNIRKDHVNMMYTNTKLSICNNGTLGTTGNVSHNNIKSKILKGNPNPKETNLREIIHRDLFEGEEQCESVLQKNVIENAKNKYRYRYPPQNIKQMETIIHKKISGMDSQRLNIKAEVAKNVMKVVYLNSSRENTNTNAIVNMSDPQRKANSHSRTPKKCKEDKAMVIHRQVKSNFLTGSGCTGKNKIIGKIQETAKTLQKKKEEVINENINNTLTPNPENKIVLKIKNFYEIIKGNGNVVIPSAHSARVKCSNKAEIGLINNNNNNNNSKKTKKIEKEDLKKKKEKVNLK